MNNLLKKIMFKKDTKNIFKTKKCAICMFKIFGLNFKLLNFCFYKSIMNGYLI